MQSRITFETQLKITLNLIQKSLDGDRPAKISIISVDELSGGGQGVGWEAGIIGGKLPNTAKNVGEKVVPSVRNEAQSLRTTKEAIQPNNKAPGELYYLVFL